MRTTTWLQTVIQDFRFGAREMSRGRGFVVAGQWNIEEDGLDPRRAGCE